MHELRPAISKPQDDWERKRATMKQVCVNCHASAFYEGFFTQFDNTIDLYDDRFGKPATELLPEAEALLPGSTAFIRSQDAHKWLQGIDKGERDRIKMFYEQRYGK